ncbi:MAG: LuxR C-terminal-related transcriptional regulator [Gemmatimonadaceae bacterium]
MRRVVVVAASPVVRAGLEALLAGAGHVVVGAAATPAEGAELASAAHAEVAVVDAASAADAALPLAPDAAARAPSLVLLADADALSLRDLLAGDGRAGIAVLPRAATPAEIVAAVDAAAAGLVALAPEAAERLLAAAPASRRAPPGAGGVPLSPREVEILGLLAEGLGNKVVAARLGISEHTVKTHVTSILEKLGAGTRAEAVAIGVRQGAILL